MKRISIKLAMILSLFFSCIDAQKWEVLFYIDSSDGLSHVIIKNITDLLKARMWNNDSSMRICIQLHTLAKEGKLGDEVYRYSVEGNALVLQEYATLTYNPVDDLVDAANWAFSGDPEAYTMLLLSNHGSGILNPSWQDKGSGFDWAPEYDVLMDEACSIKRRCHIDECHRGLMFLKEPKVYMSVSQLRQALKAMNSTIFNGTKIDILGMDMCMMSMLEVGYEVAPYVHYMIGSQDCELEYGWDYKTVFKRFGDPVEVAKTVIESYKYFYTTHAKRGTYTQAAINLTAIHHLKNNVDQISTYLISYINAYGTPFIEALKDMRKQLPKFCLVPMYTDLYALYEGIEELLLLYNDHQDQADLLEALQEGKNLIKKAVVANCAGEQRQYVHGISIYFPLSHIDSSYADSLFAQDSQWTNVLQQSAQS